MNKDALKKKTYGNTYVDFFYGDRAFFFLFMEEDVLFMKKK